jgi:hypothetical protein
VDPANCDRGAAPGKSAASENGANEAGLDAAQEGELLSGVGAVKK